MKKYIVQEWNKYSGWYDLPDSNGFKSEQRAIALLDYHESNKGRKNYRYRLIAAAPELLEALERISTAYDETLRHTIAAPLLQAIYAARAAIAKAKGGAQ